MPICIGVVINPLAGVGGAVGLKGSDGAQTVAQARARQASFNAGERALPALLRLRAAAGRADFEVVTAAGAMGEDACRAAGLPARVVASPAGSPSAPADTAAACRAFVAHGATLILFAGGDGTARDVAAAVGTAFPVIGIPCGVKMYSGVFALTAARAGEVAAQCMQGPFDVQPVELLDIDEAELRADRSSSRLHGHVLAPVDRTRMQSSKAQMPGSGRADIDAACRQLAAQCQRDTLYIVGPGTTMATLCEHMGVRGTMLGVDAVVNGRLAAADASEATLLALLDEWPSASIMVGVIGRQGCLFGRGNQPISARVLQRVPRQRIEVVASVHKLLSLVDGRLFVDTGNGDMDRALAGPLRIRTGANRSMVMRLTS
ncbi:ATP-NAD kinase family protein [Paraburkholderia sp. BCC1886]|uniref:ATP-NAD kinase family protein n=1 Tax=Paraburkholderia sp. BCC1886 TaxID=2562670 RepID=UPI001183B179|nr:ATP-NAD kinase family protein [Paraburkholderia sp. BCC1886]